MIETAFMVYAVITLPFVVFLLMALRGYLKRRREDAGRRPALGGNELERIKDVLQRNFGDSVVIETAPIRFPSAEESVQRRIEDLRASIMPILLEGRREHQVIMEGVKACADASTALLDRNDRANPGQAIENFIHSLEYARDKFASTKGQKTTLETIISNVKKSHAAR